MSNRKVVAIHQPSFFPWLGFFDKIVRSDVFVLLDNVQFPKKGGVWTNRVRVLMNGKPHWLTVPVDRSFHGTRLINEMLINNKTNWREKMIKSLQQNYTTTNYFKVVMPVVESLINQSTANLSEYNIKSICTLAELVGLSTDHFVLASTLDTGGTSNDRLISITKKVGGAVYMCGGGAEGYQDEEKFASAGLKLTHQHFSHPVYTQAGKGEFVPGLSIIDTLFNVGSEAVAKMLRDRLES